MLAHHRRGLSPPPFSARISSPFATRRHLRNLARTVVCQFGGEHAVDLEGAVGGWGGRWLERRYIGRSGRDDLALGLFRRCSRRLDGGAVAAGRGGRAGAAILLLLLPPPELLRSRRGSGDSGGSRGRRRRRRRRRRRSGCSSDDHGFACSPARDAAGRHRATAGERGRGDCAHRETFSWLKGRSCGARAPWKRIKGGEAKASLFFFFFFFLRRGRAQFFSSLSHLSDEREQARE